MSLKDLNDADELYDRIIQMNYKQFTRAPGFEERTLAIQHTEGEEDMYVDSQPGSRDDGEWETSASRALADCSESAALCG